MHHLKIQEIKRNFRVTEAVLSERAQVATYIRSFSSLIVERMINKLAEDENIRGYLVSVEMIRFKKVINEFISMLYIDPFEQALIDRIEYVGKVHFSINLLPEHLSQGYDILRQVIIELAAVNEAVKRDLNIILKMIHITEFIMHDTYYAYTIQEKKVAALQSGNFPLIEKLFQANTIHKRAQTHLKSLNESSDRRVLLETLMPELTLDSDACMATALYKTLLSSSQSLADPSLDLSMIKDQHNLYHQKMQEFLALIREDASDDVIHVRFDELNRLFLSFVLPVESMLNNKFNTMFMIINSAMQLISSAGRKFQSAGLYRHEGGIQLEELTRLITELFTYNFNWCIDEIVVAQEVPEKERFSYLYELKLKQYTLFVGMRLQHGLEFELLRDLITLMLENIKNNLIIMEREKSLEYLADRSEEANKAKDMFLANMSHELRTPLNAIIGFSQILGVKKDIPEQYHSYLEKIGISGKNLLNLVNTILDFAKLEAGKLQFKPEDSNTYLLIKEVLTIVEPAAVKKKIELIYPTFTSHMLFMDPQLIKQVLINLLTNAIKFTDENGRIELKAEFDGHGAFHFSVCDNGIGIPLESQSKLFQPFAQVDNPFQKSAQGTGLGLAISKKIVEDLHNGKMWLESIPDEGSCFHFTLPIEENNIFVERVVSENENAKRMLIVEDARDYINILIEKLKGEYHLTLTNSINKAKELLENETFDIGIYDFFLIDGISTELITFMEHADLDFPVLVISAEQDHDLMVSFQASSFVEGIFNKGYINDVLNALTKQVNRHD